MYLYLRNLCEYIIADILVVTTRIPVILTMGFAILAIIAVFLFLIQRRDNIGAKASSVISCFFIVMTLCYIIIILYITIFSRNPGSRTGVDLLLFATIGHGAKYDAYVIENILLFLPLGMLLPLCNDKINRLWQGVFPGLVLSLLIEITQYLTKRGHIQIDDIIMNVLGTGIGCLLYRGLLNLRKGKV